MGVVFSVPDKARRERYIAVMNLPCPECGLTVSGPRGVECSRCFGHGGDTAAIDAFYATEEETLDVSNVNAAFIVTELLGLGRDDVVFGSMAPTLLIKRLAQNAHRAPSGVIAPSETRRVTLSWDGVGEGGSWINCGRRPEQIERYIIVLRNLAVRAIERDEKVIWG